MALPCKKCLVLARCKISYGIDPGSNTYFITARVNSLISSCENLQKYFDVYDLPTRVRKNFLEKAAIKPAYKRKIKCLCKTMNYPERKCRILLNSDITVKRGRGKAALIKKWLR